MQTILDQCINDSNFYRYASCFFNLKVFILLLNNNSLDNLVFKVDIKLILQSKPKSHFLERKVLGIVKCRAGLYGIKYKSKAKIIKKKLHKSKKKFGRSIMLFKRIKKHIK